MTPPRFVTRLVARLAFLASLLFALGSWPCTFAALASASSESGTLAEERDENEMEEGVLARQALHDERRVEPTPPPRGAFHVERTVARAVPFAPAARLTRSPPRPPYRPLLRMLC